MAYRKLDSTATSSAVAVESVPRQLAGMAGAGNNALRQVGAALGPAVLGLVLASRLRTDPSGALRLTAGLLTGLFALIAAATSALFTCRADLPDPVEARHHPHV